MKIYQFMGLCALCFCLAASPALAAVPTVTDEASRWSQLVGDVIFALVATSVPAAFLTWFKQFQRNSAVAILRNGLLDIAEAAVAIYRDPENTGVVTVETAIAHTAETAIDRLGDSIKVLKLTKTDIYERAADRINRLLFNRDEQ
jgi:hypothetical protein